MSAVLIDTFLGDIPIERIEYLTVVRQESITVHSPEQTTITRKGSTCVLTETLEGVYRVWNSLKMKNLDGVWCSVERPVGCLALMVVVSE